MLPRIFCVDKVIVAFVGQIFIKDFKTMEIFNIFESGL